VEAQDDPYAILGVDRGASTREVRHARNRLLLHWHPDRTQDPQAVAHAALINAAYEVLSDPDLRAAYDRGTPNTSLVSILNRPRASAWTPPAADGVKAAAQQRVVDQFKSSSRPVRLPARRWSDTVTWPASAREVWVRLLARALPFGILAAGFLLALPRLDRLLPPVLVPAVPYLALFAVAAVVRGLAGRATTFGNEGWGRFTASWVVGVAAIVAADRWVLPLLPASPGPWLRLLAPVILLLVSALAVYRVTRGVRVPG
jgi:DnaJ domain